MRRKGKDVIRWRYSERLAAQFNRERPKKMAIFAHDHIGDQSVRQVRQAGPGSAVWLSRAASVQIEVRRLDDLNLPLGGFCFMKIDVEGFEPEVLRGAMRTITAHQPIIVIEQLEREFVDGQTESIEMLSA